MKTDELVESIKKGDASRVAALLDEDRQLRGAKAGSVSAILLALYHGRRDIAQLFVDRGAVLDLFDACAMGDRPRVEALLRDDPALVSAYSADGFPALGLAIFFGQPDIARLLIERGADVSASARNPQQVAPIHAAAAVRDHQTMRLLLDRGADANARQQQGVTALHGAASRGDVEMAKMLLAAGADPESRSDDGKTAADFADERGQSAFAEWFRSRS